jgi:putative mRNA 3-end processing factor
VLGSAQIVIEQDGTRLVYSGDYKPRADATCAAFEPVVCDIFITEATFGLPVFRHPPAGTRSPSCWPHASSFPTAPSWSAPMPWARRSG